MGGSDSEAPATPADQATAHLAHLGAGDPINPPDDRELPDDQMLFVGRKETKRMLIKI